ncbi:MAG: beta-N-acetylhexosaminidase, partial [Chitinophagales bacterium]
MIRFYFSLQYFLIFCAFLFLQFHYISPAHAQTTVKSGIIPLPVSVKILPGNFELSNATHITWNNPDDAATASIFNSQLKQQYSIVIHEEANSNLETNVIRMQRINAGELPAEGYRISIDENKIIIQAKDGAGIFYALQSLLQLCPPMAASGKLLIPKTILIDYPRFNWRGMHLDVARHFFSKEQVKKYIDYLAAYKFNTFHWHLTDDQGWRIEIKKYPLLTSVGAWRDGTLIGHYSNQPQFDSIRYGGFYSQEDIREVVAYAQKRFITIVPEIEMPGHVLALLSAYPELACSGSSFNVAKNWGVFNDVLCPTEETISFMQNVLLEVMELFPSKYIHIGGDECPKEQWQKSVYCQNLMQQLGLKNENALQGYFTQRIETFVSAHGRSIIGWDEILEDGLSTSAAVMSWRGIDGGTAAASSNHNVVMSPTDFCYFDYYQSQNTHEPLAIGGYVPLEKVYAFEPMPPALATDKQSFIMGGQANV